MITRVVFAVLFAQLAFAQGPPIDPIILRPVEPKKSDFAPVYRVGGGVSAPKAIYSPDPQYSKEARKAKYQATVILWLIVGPDGLTHDIKVARSAGMGLDEKAIEAVKKWRFKPALKDNKPVAVQINVQIDFRL